MGIVFLPARCREAGEATPRESRETIRPIGVRLADLPVNASLCDVLRLFLHFQTPELEDSGLLARVMEAQTEVADLIDRITVLLKPLGIEREAISQFVWEQIKEGATIQQLGAGGAKGSIVLGER